MATAMWSAAFADDDAPKKEAADDEEPDDNTGAWREYNRARAQRRTFATALHPLPTQSPVRLRMAGHEQVYHLLLHIQAPHHARALHGP
eukprot:877728-Prymnesium_polylepis.1